MSDFGDAIQKLLKEVRKVLIKAAEIIGRFLQKEEFKDMLDAQYVAEVMAMNPKLAVAKRGRARAYRRASGAVEIVAGGNGRYKQKFSQSELERLAEPGHTQ